MLSGAGAAAFALSFFALPASLPLAGCSSTGQIPFEQEARDANAAISAYQEGQALEREEKYGEALASYERALPYSKTHDAALYKIGRLSSLIEDWERAESAFGQLLLDDPGNISVRQSLAYVYCRSGREGEGLELYRELHEKAPHDEKIFQGYIKALRLNGLEEEAELEEEAFASLFPQRMSK